MASYQVFHVPRGFQDHKSFCAHHVFSTYEILKAQCVSSVHWTLDAHSISQASRLREDH